MPRPRNASPVYKLRPGPAGVFVLSWTEPESGWTRRLSTGQRERAAAEIWRDRYLAGLASAPPPDQPSLADMLAAYVQARTPHVADPERLANAAARVSEKLGRLQPGDFSQAAADRYAAARLAEGRGPGTVKRELAALRAALRFAAAARWPGCHPAPVFRMPVQPPAPRDWWLTRPQVQAWIDAAQAPHIALFIELAIGTAHRRRAIESLRWEQVDLTSGRIDFGAGQGKKRRSVVPVTARLARVLAEHLAARTTGYVIEFNGRAPVSVRRGLETAARRAGIAHARAHILRHSACTWMALDGVPLAEIARFAGMTEEMAARVYAKHTPDYLRRASAALEF